MMLTARQQSLFRQLEETLTEKEVRALHKQMVKEHGAVKDFTTWLLKRLYRKWALERKATEVPYLGN
jgi:hypothetical protein